MAFVNKPPVHGGPQEFLAVEDRVPAAVPVAAGL